MFSQLNRACAMTQRSSAILGIHRKRCLSSVVHMNSTSTSSESSGDQYESGKQSRTDSSRNNLRLVRISKLLTFSGSCSRREAEEWIKAGRVKLGDELVRSPSMLLDVRDVPTKDIVVDGIKIRLPKLKQYLLSDPSGDVDRSSDSSKAIGGSGKVRVWGIKNWMVN
jgi:hypothetical protein